MELWISSELGQPIHYDVLPDGLPDTDELGIVVLGFQLNPDGTMKTELIERLTVALNSAKKYPNAYIVYTGGGTAASDYHIATGELLFAAESILRANAPGNDKLQVVSNAAWEAPSGSLSSMFQAGALIELSRDVETAFDIYYENYDIHELPPLH